jgi:D-glycero-D-manno-heptose 1,7-bisphosphate phosphatase
VVTNQSGIARGYFSEVDVNCLHEHIQRELEPFDARIDAFYVCPHHPTAVKGDYRLDCNCRKCSPGLLLQAAKEHGIDLKKSFMVGDKLADIEAGHRAGCQSVLVLTGYGQATSEEHALLTVKKFINISDAVDSILS